MHSLIIFLCGYFLSVTILRWSVHERIALLLIKFLGKTYARIMLAVMSATFFLSMLMPNMVCIMLLIPLVTEITKMDWTGSDQLDTKERHQTLFLAVMYAANIGGIATLIGTPTNIVFANTAKILLPQFVDRIDFAHWFLVGGPCAIVLLLTAWVYLLLVMRSQMRSAPTLCSGVDTQLAALGPLTKGEKYAIIATIVTIVAWMSHQNLYFGSIIIPGWADMLKIGAYVNDSVIALIAMLVLLLIPIDWNNKVFLLDVDSLKKHIPWKALLLITGGYCVTLIGRALGIIPWLTKVLHGIAIMPFPFLLFSVAVFISFVTEIAFNVLVISIMLPVLHSLGSVASVHPLSFLIMGTISASCAFASPIATSTNAIVYSTGKVKLTSMIKVGLGFNLVAVVIIVPIVHYLVPVVFGTK